MSNSDAPPAMGSYSDSLNRVRKAAAFTAYRTSYEARNSYVVNIALLEEVETAVTLQQNSEGGSTASQLVLDDVRKLRQVWETKWAAYDQARKQEDAEKNTVAGQSEWLKQMELEEQAAAEAAKAKASERRAKMAAKKKGGRRGRNVTASSSDDDEGNDATPDDKGQRGSKISRNAVGMERGSSLTAHLAALEGKPFSPTAKDVEDEAGSSSAKSPSSPSVPQFRAEYKTVPFSFVPPSLWEGEGVPSGMPLCTLTPIENTPLVTIHFNTPLKEIPVPPKRPTTQQPKKGQGKKKGKNIEKEKTPDPIQGNFALNVVVHRVVVAAQQTIPSTQLLSQPGESDKRAAVAAAELSAAPAVLGGKQRQQDQQEAPKSAEEDSTSSDEEMVLEDTADYDEENQPPAEGSEELDSDEEAERLQRMVVQQRQMRENNLQELSQQLVAQYSEIEEEDELGRHAKARDMPPIITKALSHWRTLTESTWVVLMCHGGYFAGAVFVNRVPILHKAFHRYVVRKKQGGKQSKHDKGGGSMSSAGGQIRRHHELKWKSTVRDIILTWKSFIDEASLILYVAPGPDNRGILTDFKDTPSSALSLNMGPAALISPIEMRDPRVRSAPMTTHRPVFSEVKRIFETVSTCTVQYQDRTEEKEPQ